MKKKRLRKIGELYEVLHNEMMGSTSSFVFPILINSLARQVLTPHEFNKIVKNWNANRPTKDNAKKLGIPSKFIGHASELNPEPFGYRWDMAADYILYLSHRSKDRHKKK